jgi:hypothetical protein
MKSVPERVYIRQHLKAPVICEDVVSGKRFHGIIHDMSVDGMHLEIDAYLQPDREIELRLHLPGPDASRKTFIQRCRLKVIWCKERIASGDKLPYAAGVRLILPETDRPHVSQPGRSRRRRNLLSI